MMNFEEFKKIVRDGEKNGEIKTDVKLTDVDIAVQWAIAKIGEKKGYPCDITVDEIWQEMRPLFDEQIQGIVDVLNGLSAKEEQ